MTLLILDISYLRKRNITGHKDRAIISMKWLVNYNDNSSLFWWILCWVSESSSVDGNHPLHGEIGGTDLSESWFDGLNKQKPYWNRWKVIREENSHCYFSTWEKFHFASFIFITVRFVFVFLLPQCIYVQWQCSKKVEWRN